MVKVTIKDAEGKEFGSFEANSEESLGTQAQENGIPIPFSCGVGACRTCVCQVEAGQESIDKEAVGPMHIMVEDDEVLSCIGSVKPDTNEEEITLIAENL